MLAVGGLGAGCWKNPAITRFANEFDCPRDRIEVESLGAQSYRLTGCAHRATYVCHANLCSMDRAPEVAGGDTVSENLGRRPARATGPRRGTLVVDGREMPALRLTLGGGLPVLFARRPGAGVPSFLVAVQTVYEGQAEQCEALQLTGGGAEISAAREPGNGARYRVEGDALRTVLGGDALRLRACRRSMWLSRPQRDGLRTFVERQLASVFDQEPDTSTAEPPSWIDPANWVRAALDERRDVLFACASQGVLGVRVRWDAAGAITVGLNGALAGTPEEECVRAQLGNLTVPNVAEAGEVVHVLTGP